MSVKEVLTKLQLQIDPGVHLLIYRRSECLCALSIDSSHAPTHLRDKHSVSPDARRGLTKILKAQGLGDPDKALPREDGSPEHPYHQAYGGFDCDGRSFGTISFRSMKRHYSDPTMRDQCRHYGQTRPSNELDMLFRSLLRPIGGKRVRGYLRSMRERERERERIRTTAVFGVRGYHGISPERL
ncbi:hypothetical protein BHE90_016112 [Fusarium euwallaceae]|uniref:Uncharacterized protein n=1 Tax=Fusarium euwallaceae TaxID=1147111 RepID=A0A430L1A4_9HYPO|nr:hypothetical protein BHE90_016112 [Fusarium euwallaceae]